MQLFAGIIFFIFGTLIGSFLNVVILRLPAGKSLSGRSACPGCGAGLAYYDLIPVFSYAALRGKCRNCGQKISPRYFIVELITGALFSIVALHFFSAEAVNYLNLLRWLVAVSFFVVIFVIDLEHFLILDKVLVAGVVIFLLLNLAFDLQSSAALFSLHSAFLGGIFAGLLAYGLFNLVWYASGGRWMGFGDVKLVFLLGLILGWPQVWVMLLLAFWLGALISVPLLASGKKKLQSAVPFGTFLTGSAFITMFYGPRLLNWYLGLIGV